MLIYLIKPPDPQRVGYREWFHSRRITQEFKNKLKILAFPSELDPYFNPIEPRLPAALYRIDSPSSTIPANTFSLPTTSPHYAPYIEFRDNYFKMIQQEQDAWDHDISAFKSLIVPSANRTDSSSPPNLRWLPPGTLSAMDETLSQRSLYTVCLPLVARIEVESSVSPFQHIPFAFLALFAALYRCNSFSLFLLSSFLASSLS